MSFLVDSDYDVQTRTTELTTLLTDGNSRVNAEYYAQEEITSYLRPRAYDITAIFAATGANRNPLIIMYMIDIVMYHLHSNIPSRAMPKHRETRFHAAMEWLKKVNEDKLDPSLPKLDTSTLPDPTWKFGDNGKYFSQW